MCCQNESSSLCTSGMRSGGDVEAPSRLTFYKVETCNYILYWCLEAETGRMKKSNQVPVPSKITGNEPDEVKSCSIVMLLTFSSLEVNVFFNLFDIQVQVSCG